MGIDHEKNARYDGVGAGVERKIEEDEIMPEDPYKGDRAIKEFSTGSLYNVTNQFGMEGRTFSVDPSVRSRVSEGFYPETLRTTKHPVQDFFVYDGAHPTIGATGKVPTTRDQILPDKRISEQDAVEWQRVGSKKGWMFNGPPQEGSPGGMGENMPTHTSDGWVDQVKNRRWMPLGRSPELQGLAKNNMAAIDIENNSRGIGVTGPGSGNGGMAGGYKQINQERLQQLPIPNSKFNWTGTRLHGTGRENQGGGTNAAGAGGYRAGYASQYPERPSFPMRRTTGLSRVTQNAA